MCRLLAPCFLHEKCFGVPQAVPTDTVPWPALLPLVLLEHAFHHSFQRLLQSFRSILRLACQCTGTQGLDLHHEGRRTRCCIRFRSWTRCVCSSSWARCCCV